MMLHEADDAQRVLDEANRVAARRVAVLEWPYAEQPFGPPLADRLTEEIIRTMAEKAGFESVEATHLTSLVLYRMAK
jgi:ubiquinone/menaquinone biosynthesis C-methylase UbiE